MMAAGVQGQPLEVTVIGCHGLRDTEWFGRQDPYVALEYGSTKYRTRTCSDGDKNPTFQEKFVFPIVQGLSEMNILVWNSNTISGDDFIGSGKAQLSKTMTQGFDDTNWPIWSRSGKHAGEVKLILRYANNFAAAPAPSSYGYSAPAPGAYPAAAPPPPHYHQPGYAPPAPSVYPAPAGYPQSSYPPPPAGSYPPGTYYPPSY